MPLAPDQSKGAIFQKDSPGSQYFSAFTSVSLSAPCDTLLVFFPGESIGLKFIPSQSELTRFIPISLSEPMRIIPNQSEKRFVSRLIRNGKKSIRLNTINSEWIRTNPKPSFQSRLIWINQISDWSKPNFQSKSIRMNPRSEWSGLMLIKSSIWISPRSDWFGLIWIGNLVSDWFGFIRIDVSELIGLTRIDFWPFLIKRDIKRFSGWFRMIRIGSNTDIGMNQNSSDWLGMIGI